MTPAHATHTHAVGLRHLCLRLRQIQFRRVECDEVELGCPPGLSEPARDVSGQPGSGDGLVSNGV